MPSGQPLGGKRRPAAPQMWQESNQTSDGWRSHHSRPTSNPKASLTRSGEANANCSAGWSEGGFRMCGLALALCRSAGYKRREKRRGGRESFGRFRRAAPLPVLQFSRHPLGEAAADQPDQEEHAHAERDHQQDVVLGWGGHHLHGQVGEALCWRHLQARRRTAGIAAWKQPQGRRRGTPLPLLRSSTCRCGPEVASYTPAAAELSCPARSPSDTTSLQG